MKQIGALLPAKLCIPEIQSIKDKISPKVGGHHQKEKDYGKKPQAVCRQLAFARHGSDSSFRIVLFMPVSVLTFEFFRCFQSNTAAF